VLTLPATSGTVVTTATSSGISGSAITTGTVGVSVGGTGANTLTANNVILGNGTSAVQFVAPGSSGNVLTSNGTTWTSAAAGGGQLKTEIFTTPGTWTKPASATQVRVTVIGGGGGGTSNPGGSSSGGTSSFGSAVSATGGGGGNYGNPSGSFASPGSGTVSSGTNIRTGSVKDHISPSFASYLNGTSFGFISAGGNAQASGSGPGVDYSVSGSGMAGSASYANPNFAGKGGCGGLACASNVPVSGPVAVTVGSGGSSSGTTVRATGGVVLVEYVG
jgi:hypothetical protein